MASEFDQYVLENIKIDDGPPVRYHFPPREENVGIKNLRRLKFGIKKMDKPNKTILLLGETGSGKSTLINTMGNYVLGIKSDDNKWFEFVDEKTTGKDTDSQTRRVTVYEIFGFEGNTFPYSLTIIDTPGYGDTKGIENDFIITESLHDLFRSEQGIHEIDAVGLVVKATENRLSDRLRYVFDSIMSLFGKDIVNNIVALITHSDGMPPKNALRALEDANIKCAKDQTGQLVHFVFNNCQSTKRTEDTEFGLDQAWRVTTRGLQKFSEFLGQVTPQKLGTTVKVLNDRIRLAACINNLTERIELITLKKREIEQTKEGLKRHEKDMETKDKVTIEVDEPYKDKERIDGGMFLFWFGGAVCCQVCKENCHYPGCTLAWYPEHCQVMKNSRCTVCTGKCHVSDHVKEKMKYVTKTRKVTKVIEVKRDNKGQIEDLQNQLSHLDAEKEELDKEINTYTDEVCKYVEQLQTMALNNSLVTYIHLDQLIKLMEDKGELDKVQKLKKMAEGLDQGIRIF